jgi:uncharacterized protein
MPDSPRDLFLGWAEYHRKIEDLIGHIYASGWAFDHVVCVARGGMRVGDIVSRVYRKPLGVIFARHDRGGAEQPRVSAHAASLDRDLAGRVLLVDDVAESGATLATVKALLRERHPQIAELRTAVLWRRSGCDEQPDYCGEQLEANTRLHPPYEPYDLSSLSGLAERRLPEK